MKNSIRKFATVTATLLLAVFICGCGAEKEETSNRTSASLTRVSKDGKEVSASNDSDISGNSAVNTTTTPSDSVSGIATGTPEVADMVTKNNYVIAPITEGLCEQLDASELGQLAAYNTFNRLERNDKTELMLEHKVCVDDKTGVVYYVNVGRDYFLYRIKDGKSELAVELPANYLYTYEGVLYFLLDAQNILEGSWKDSVKGRYMYDKFTFEGMSEGDIYSYTPANGKVELVYPAQALRLKVTDEGIFYLKGKLDKNEKYNATGLEWYYIPFGGSEPQSIESGGMYDVWNGYQYDWSGDNLRLKSEVTGDMIEVVTDSEYRYTRSYIFKNKIFSLNVFSTECFDLLTREEVFSYNLWESVSATDWTSGLETSKRQGVARFLKQLIEKGNIQSKRFALTEDSMLWFVLHNQFVYRINLETGETQLFYYNGKGIIAENSCLYTDGKNLYAIYYVGSIVGEEPVFARLFFEYDEKTGVWYWDVTDKIGVND